MRRPHLFEFLDQAWYPAPFRRMQTDYLRFVHSAQVGPHPAASVLERALRRTGATRVVDLCSGGAGPWTRLQPELARSGVVVSVKLTDLHPTPEAVLSSGALPDGNVEYVAEPVDAAAVPEHLQGMRTLFEGFHHFRPEAARRVLLSAVAAGAPIGVFEVAIPRTLALLLAPALALMTVLAYLLVTPTFRPRSLTRLLWTYPLPVVPLATSWDGIVSFLRVYSPDQLRALVASIPSPDYVWEIGEMALAGPVVRLVYLLGYPTTG
jgi:hypothetical protein